ncbi:hypothetical protein [Actinomadura sp. DC4]|uniref:hypothetical protein n=1 Tax=Actinomadura sp. DC4 TaxID=3055069 RepID=UPI0025B1C6C4|nr:hypothetical protein [Actinomadura sp. DC4]MDN3358085.1 hypothetical protein [Actinomadura sp. DC4]
MSTVAVVVIVIVVLAVIGVVGYFARGQARRRGLQQRFGPEYDRTVESHESTKEAEQELLARQKRHDELEIHPLDPETRERHIAEWRQVQERFVDEPESAVTEADRLLVLVMGERGYPTEGYEQQVSDLSVEHASTIDRYRQAHDISTQAEAKKASTEDLRQAMVHYRTLFAELLDTDGESITNGHSPVRTGTDAGTATETDAVEAETAEPVAEPAETRADAATREPVAAEPVASEPVSEPVNEPVERDAARADTGAAAGTPEETPEEAAAERTEAKPATRTRTARRTTRRDSDDKGA